VIRASLQQITRRDALRAPRGRPACCSGWRGRRCFPCPACGTAIAAIVAGILAVCLWANVVGSLVPIMAERVGIDPTVISAPLLATLVDATGLLIYLSIAGFVLSRV
jgi:Mg/Co/Ni transporter MgtE